MDRKRHEKATESVSGFGHSNIRGFRDCSPYRQVNGPPWALPSDIAVHSFLCQHSAFADRPNPEMTIALSRRFQFFGSVTTDRFFVTRY